MNAYPLNIVNMTEYAIEKNIIILINRIRKADIYTVYVGVCCWSASIASHKNQPNEFPRNRTIQTRTADNTPWNKQMSPAHHHTRTERNTFARRFYFKNDACSTILMIHWSDYTVVCLFLSLSLSLRVCVLGCQLAILFIYWAICCMYLIFWKGSELCW